MEAREWRTAEKAEWGPGPWQDEPDKAQWIDEATGPPLSRRQEPRRRALRLCGRA